MRNRSIAFAAAVLSIISLVASADGLDSVVQLSIKPQAVASALLEFSNQTKLQVVSVGTEVRDRQSQGVQGKLTASEALTRLLQGTGLSYEPINKQTVRILQPKELGQPPPAAGAVESGDFRLARVEDEAAAGAATGPERTGSQSGIDESSKGIPEMLVKGARTSNIDIQRTEDDVQPYVVFTANDIEHSMAPSLDQFLMSRLPMNASQYAADVLSNVPINGNISSINLRGLGADQTLILVNGRRVPGVSTSTDLLQPDINGIPMSSIERIEVLPSTAGGIYGGGATGGVINIILKNDYRGLEVNARYDGTFRQDAQQRVLDASAGFSLEQGRTTVMLSVSHQDSISLLNEERDFAVRTRALLLKNNPAIYDGTTIPLGNTSNIRSSNGSPLVLAAGNRPLGSAITHVPYGYAGPASDGGTALLANAGKYNLDITNGHFGGKRGLTGAPAVDSLRLNVRRHFTDRIEAFIDAARSTNDSTSDWGSVPHNFTNIPVGAPNNPFTTPINVRFSSNDYNHSTDVIAASEVLNVTGGAIVRLQRNWTVQAEYGWGESERDYALSQTLTAFGIFETQVSNGNLSLLRDVSVYPNDYSSYVGTEQFTSYQPGPQGANMRNLTLRLAGPTLTLRGGPVMLSALVERRQDEVDSAIFGTLLPALTWRYNYSAPRKQTTEGAYAELTMPLISAANTLPLVRALDLQLSYRRDRIGSRTIANNAQNSIIIASPDSPIPDVDYQTNHVEANQYTLGLRYQPFESLTLRVSNAVGVLPPSLSQLVPTFNSNINVSNTTDPLRADSPVGVVAQRRSSGNPDLLPEQSDSWSAGAIFTPTLLPGLRLSVDYTRIEKTDEISTLTPQTILDRESLYPGRVGRLPMTDADRLANYTGGRINYLDISMTNIAYTRVEAFDYRIDYQWSTRHGVFRANAIATNQVHFQKQLLSGAPVTEYMGFYDGPLKWRGNAGITWERNAWSLGWNTQYYDSFPVYGTTASATSRASNILNQGAEFIPHQIYHDLSFRYRIDEVPVWGGIFARSSILVGISNVFDEEPPLMMWAAAATFTPAVTARYGDPRLRRYSISLRKNFR